MKPLKKTIMALALAGTLLCLGGCELELPDGSQVVPGGGLGGGSTAAGETVTAAQWEAAFREESFSNCKIEYTTDFIDADKTPYQLNSLYIKDGNKEYAALENMDYPGITSEIYYQINGDEVVCLMRSGEGSWTSTRFSKESMSSFILLFTKPTLVLLNAMIPEDDPYWEPYPLPKDFYVVDYRDFSYNEKEGGYVASKNGTTAIYKFQDNKIVSIVLNVQKPTRYPEPWRTITGTMTFTMTYGGQTVTLPAVSE